jgi:hypothetical protein
MAPFNYSAPAEIFGSGGVGKRKHPVRYQRFSSGAHAVRFVIEGVPATLLTGIVLESDEDRFDHAGIRALYDSPDYPLERESPAR